MKINLVVFSLLAAILAPAFVWGGEMAFVNLQVIVAESKMGKQAREEFNRTREKREEGIKERLRELEGLKAGLQQERKKEPANEKQVAGLVERLQQKNKEYERHVADVKEELTRKDQEMVKRILEKIAPILTELATSRGYTMILKNAAELAYLAPQADITGEVLKRLDK